MKHIYFFTLFLSFLSAQAQNSCAGALALTTLGDYTVSNIDGTPPSNICISGNNIQTAGEWYTYTPSTDMTLIISTDLPVNTGGDTRLNVFTGDCSNLICLGGDDDGGSGYLSTFTFNALANTTYYICFDNLWSSDGFVFNLSQSSTTDISVGFSTSTLYQANGYNMVAVDMNGDFLDDIVSVGGNNLHIQYQNPNGGFTSQQYTITGNVAHNPSWSIVAGDMSGNGYNDLLYCNGSGVTFIFSGSNASQFSAVDAAPYIFSQRSNMVDINNDGNLDVFVCHDIDPNVFFINNGTYNWPYTQGGLGDHPEGGNYGSIWTDYDNDGDMDLFIAKCRGGGSTANINELHRNNGDGTFSEVAAAANMADNIQTWSSAWGDFDNDGDMDALVGANSFSNGGHKLMLNNGDGTFTNATTGTGWENVSYGTIEFTTYDFNNDGYLDVLTGMNYGTLFLNNGDLTFTQNTYNVHYGPVGDFNNDGFLDIKSGSQYLYLNNGNDNHWITITTTGTASNKNGIGARLELYGAWGKQIREVRSGVGFALMSTLNTHFGLGEATAIDSLVIKWPSGIVDTYENPDIDGVWHAVEGETLGVDDINPDRIQFSVSPNPAEHFIHIETEENIQFIQIFSVDGKLALESEQEDIDISGLSSGTYFIKVLTTEKQVNTLKFIKK